MSLTKQSKSSILGDLKVSLNYNRAFVNSRSADAGQINAALRYDPTQPVYDSSSPFGGFYQHINRTPGGILIENGTRNPVAALLQNDNRSNKDFIFMLF